MALNLVYGYYDLVTPSRLAFGRRLVFCNSELDWFARLFCPDAATRRRVAPCARIYQMTSRRRYSRWGPAGRSTTRSSWPGKWPAATLRAAHGVNLAPTSTRPWVL